jgi:hypothetical protein
MDKPERLAFAVDLMRTRARAKRRVTEAAAVGQLLERQAEEGHYADLAAREARARSLDERIVAMRGMGAELDRTTVWLTAAGKDPRISLHEWVGCTKAELSSAVQAALTI